MKLMLINQILQSYSFTYEKSKAFSLINQTMKLGNKNIMLLLRLANRYSCNHDAQPTNNSKITFQILDLGFGKIDPDDKPGFQIDSDSSLPIKSRLEVSQPIRKIILSINFKPFVSITSAHLIKQHIRYFKADHQNRHVP